MAMVPKARDNEHIGHSLFGAQTKLPLGHSQSHFRVDFLKMGCLCRPAWLSSVRRKIRASSSAASRNLRSNFVSLLLARDGIVRTLEKERFTGVETERIRLNAGWATRVDRLGRKRLLRYGTPKK